MAVAEPWQLAPAVAAARQSAQAAQGCVLLVTPVLTESFACFEQQNARPLIKNILCIASLGHGHVRLAVIE